MYIDRIKDNSQVEEKIQGGGQVDCCPPPSVQPCFPNEERLYRVNWFYIVYTLV